MINLELTQKETEALIVILDIAVRSQGLSHAKFCVELAEKIKKTAQKSIDEANNNH